MRDAHELAEVLRNEPEVDELTMMRGERELLSAVAEGRHLEEARPERRLLSNGAAIGLVAIAAALALFFLTRGAAPADVTHEGTAVAAFEALRDGVPVRSGELSEGESVQTAESQALRVTPTDSAVDVLPNSRARFVRVVGDDLHVALERGAVRVEFHPERRGEQSFLVTTPHARVEVVGTVFQVRSSASTTQVSVSEGTVRVVAASGEIALIHAGEEREVRDGELVASGATETSVVPEPAVMVARADLETESETESETIAVEPEAAALREATRRTRTPSRQQPRPPTNDVVDEGDAVGERGDEQALSTADRFALADRQYDTGEFAQARTTLRPVAQRGSSAQRARAFTSIAESFAREGAHDRAAESYGYAADIGRGTAHGANALFALARTQARRGQNAAAKRAYHRYLDEYESGPLAESARRALCRLGEPAHCD